MSRIDPETGAGAAGETGARARSSAWEAGARALLDEGREALAARVRALASELRDGAPDGAGAAHLAERTAEGAERLARALREQELSCLLREAGELARRSPTLGAAAAVTAGFLLARWLLPARACADEPGRASRPHAAEEGL